MAERGSAIVKPLSMDDLCVVQEALYVVRTHWYNMGLKLGLKPDVLDTIEIQCSGDPSICFRETLKKYLQTITPSWTAIVEALKSPTVDQPQLAEKVGGEFCSAQEPETEAPQNCDESLPNSNRSSMPLSPSTPDHEMMSETESELHSFATKTSTSSALSTDEQHLPKDYGCGCGGCSFNSFFERGCPKPILSMSSFSYLNTEGLDESQKRILKGRLYREFEVITTDFGYLVYNTCDSLVKQGTTVQELVRLLMALGAFQPTLCERPLLQECSEELEAADNIDKVFRLLIFRGYMSFFSYRIIEYIVGKFGTQQDKEDLRNYTTKFNEYARRSIFECPAYSLARKDQANLVVKLEGVNLEEYSLTHLAVFESRISDIIEVTEYTLRLCTVKDGCVELTFQMPHFVKEVVFPLSDSQKAALQAEGVTRLTCEDYQYPIELTSAGIGMVPLDLAADPNRIKTRAEEIVSGLERASQEKSLYQTPKLTASRPATLQSKPVPSLITRIPAVEIQDGACPSEVIAHGLPSPVAEQPGCEYTPTPSPLSTTPNDELLEKRLGGVGEPAFATMAPENLEQYPIQEVLHHFCREHLTPGEDGRYLEHRNYILNDVYPLGEGVFGICVPGQDLRTQKMFALKRNIRSDAEEIDSIRRECAVLARLPSHDNVVQFWGAVLDEDRDQPLPRVVKMIMELAENGSLYDMLMDEDKNPAPLPEDQSLYYLHQILQGVHFLHMNGVLHLDIKADNVLVFNSGRTVKLANFQSAMHMDNESSIGVGTLKGLSPHFAAPEVICQHQPTFSADIWSTACVLIQMLTAKLPGCYKMERTHHSMMYLIGKYTDDDLQQLVPIQEMQLDSDVVELFRLVLQRNPHKRPTALYLLEQVPCIVNACEYEKYFDFEYEEEQYSTCEDEGSFCTAPTSPSLCLPPPLEHELVNSDKLDHCASRDSGVGSLRSDRTSTKGSSTGGSSRDSAFDSSSDTGYVNLIPYRMRASSHSQATPSGHPPTNVWGWNYKYDGEFRSLPISSNSPRFIDQLRCLSLDSKLDRRLGYSQQPLYSSSSAPELSLGPLARSNSWQGERSRVPMQTKLRRTSSEVYVDRGTDIDTPEEKKRTLFQLQLQQPTPTSSFSSASKDHFFPSHTSSRSSYVSVSSSFDTVSFVSLDRVLTSSQEGGLEGAAGVKRLENKEDTNTKKTFRDII